MTAYVYILRDKGNRLYIGSTLDLSRRLKQHKKGHTQTTRRMNEPKLVFKQQYNSIEEARCIERKMKKLKRKDYIEKIISDGYCKMKKVL